jgi:hypothetical protein
LHVLKPGFPRHLFSQQSESKVHLSFFTAHEDTGAGVVTGDAVGRGTGAGVTGDAVGKGTGAEVTGDAVGRGTGAEVTGDAVGKGTGAGVTGDSVGGEGTVTSSRQNCG